MSDLLSHHDFRKSIALTWINPDPIEREQISVGKMRYSEEISVASAITIDISISSIKTRLTPVNNSSVKCTSNFSCIRLDKSLAHYLEITRQNAKCMVHR